MYKLCIPVSGVDTIYTVYNLLYTRTRCIHCIVMPLNFDFKDTVKATFKTAKDAPNYEEFGKNILSGGVAGSMSLFFVYSLDYCRTLLANDAKTKTGTRQCNGMIDVYVKTISYTKQ